MIILIDTREQMGWDFSFFDVETKSQKLDTGDYTIEGTDNLICVERKRNTGELAINLGQKKKQFDAEMERMKDFKFKYLVFEFSIGDMMSFPKNSGIPKDKLSKIRMNSKYMMKCLEEYQNKYGIEILYCNNKDEACETALELFKEALCSN